MKEVQQRLLSLWPDLGAKKASDVLQQIRKVLYDAFSEDLMKPKGGEINRHVKLERSKDPCEYLIVGGIKDFRRDPESARLLRNDGAWLHFTMTLREAAGGCVEMLAYDFELVFPEQHSPPWIRFDLNLPDHPNEGRDLRSHVHPGNDEILLPAPIMSPVELLRLLIHKLRPRDPARVRTP